jgi:hypothetical protein
MVYLAVLIGAGGAISLSIAGLVMLRFKELRVQRVVTSLEWLATNTRSGDALMLWERASSRQLDVGSYMRVIWHASFEDLRMAGRLGAKLQRLSLFPLPDEVSRELSPGGVA